MGLVTNMLLEAGTTSSVLTSEMQTMLSENFTAVATTILTVIGLALGAALTVVGAIVAIKAGINFFKSAVHA